MIESKKQEFNWFWHLIFLTLLFGVIFWPLLNEKTYPAHDSYLYFFPQFLYFANSVYHGFGIPFWFPSGGGHPIALTSVSESYFLPYRLIGWLIYQGPFSPILSYKLTLILGLVLVSVPWWLFIRKICNSRLAASLGVALFLLSGTSITMFHQETVLMSIWWISWFGLTVIYIPKDFRYLVVAAIVGGLGCATYSVPVFVFTITFFLLTPGFLLNAKRFFAQCWNRPKVVILAAVGFLASSSLTIFTVFGVDGFLSPVRAGRVSLDSLEAYVESIKWGMTANPGYLANYISPQTEVFLDQFAFFIPSVGLLLATCSILVVRRQPRIWLTAVMLTGLLVLASTGTEFGFAQALYQLEIPLVKYFRNWVHFVGVINLSIVFLAALGFVGIIKNLGFSKVKNLPAIVFCTVVLFAYISGTDYRDLYVAEVLTEHSASASEGKFNDRLNQETFLSVVRGGWFKELRRVWLTTKQKHAGLCDILISEEWWGLLATCPDVTKGTAYSAGPETRLCKAELDYPNPREAIPLLSYNLIDESEVDALDETGLMTMLCDRKIFNFAVIGDVKSELQKGLNMLELGKLDWTSFGKFRANVILPSESLVVTPKGATITGQTEDKAFLLIPFSARMGFQASLNGERVELAPAYGGALTGVVVGPGNFRLKLWFDMGIGQLLIHLQVLMPIIALLIAFYLRMMRSTRTVEWSS